MPRADARDALELLQELIDSESSGTGATLKSEDVTVCEGPSELAHAEGSKRDGADPTEGALETDGESPEADCETTRNSRVRPSWLELAAVTAPLLISLASDPLAGMAWSPDESEVLAPMAVELYTLLFELPSIFLISWIVFGLYRSPSRFGLSAPRLWDVGTGILLVVAWLMIDQTVRSVIPREPGSPGTEPLSATAGVFAIVLVVTVVSAASEELYYRSYLIPQLSTLLRSRALAVVVSALIFGWAHAYQGAPGVVSATVFGLFFGVMFLFLKRMWPLAMAHALANILRWQVRGTQKRRLDQGWPCVAGNPYRGSLRLSLRS